MKESTLSVKKVVFSRFLTVFSTVEEGNRIISVALAFYHTTP